MKLEIKIEKFKGSLLTKILKIFNIDNQYNNDLSFKISLKANLYKD